MTHARRVTALAATAASIGALLIAAPAAQAGNCISSYYSGGGQTGFRAWCGSAAAGSQFRQITVCQTGYAPVRSYTVYGDFERNGGSRWSYALCRSGDTPANSYIDKI